MKASSSTRWAIGTLAVVAIALSVDSLRRTGEEYDGARAAPKVIRLQLDAFNRDDYRAAYRLAAPEIQAQFPLSEFRRMVQAGYPQIARSRKAVFGAPEARGDHVNVPVTVTGQDGVTVQVLYMMRHESGGWRVAGVAGDRPPGSRPPPRRMRPQPRRESDTVSLPRPVHEGWLG